MRVDRIVIAAAAVVLTLAMSAPASATTVNWNSVSGDHRFATFVNGVSDQANLTNFLANGGSGSFVDALQYTAQSFTVGATGVLTRLDLGLYKHAAAVGDVSLDLFSFTGTPPADLSAPLLHKVIPIASIPLLTTTAMSVDLTSFGLAVTSGSQFAIVLSRTAPRIQSAEVVWQDSNFAGYAGGSFFTGNPVAAVATPEPATLVLVGLGSAAMAVRRRIRRR